MPRPKSGLQGSLSQRSKTASDVHPLAGREARDETALMLPLSRLKPDPNQPRKHLDESGLTELSASIKELGVLQALLVLKANDDYMIIAGQRRYEAAKLAGLTDVPARVFTDPERVREAQLVENLQREDLNLLDEAAALAELKKNLGISLRDLETIIGKSKSYIDRRLKVLEMPEDVQAMLSSGELSLTQAEEVTKINSPAQRKARMLALTGKVEGETAGASTHRKTAGRPSIPFKFKQKKNGGFELVVKYQPGQTDRQEIIEQLKEALEKLENS